MMALETSRLNFQLQNFSRVLTENAVNLEQYTKNTGVMLSLSSQIKSLHTFEKKHESQIDAPTSGESSPCQSDSEIESRVAMPTLQEISELLTDELALEVDASPEKFKGFHGRDLTLVFEDFDVGFQKNRFYRYLKETRYSNYISDKIAYPREMKNICFRGNNSLLVNICVRKADLLAGLMDTFLSILKKETRRPVKMYKVLDDRRNKELWFGVIIRNLPPKVTHKDILTQCQREVTGQLNIGTLIKVKDRHCCIIRCDYLEDAEIICKKLNNFQLKDPTTNMKYVLKVHIHPQSAHRHLVKDKSPFSDFIQSTEKPGSDKPGVKGGKTGIGELLEIFTKSKKPSEKQKPPPPPPIGGPKRNESMEEEKAEAAAVNGMDTVLKRIYSGQTETQVKPQSVSKETEETQATSVFTRMIKQSASEGGTGEREGRGSQEGSLNGKEGVKEEKENQMEEEMKGQEANMKNDNFERKNYETNIGKLSIKKEYDDKRYDKRNERSSSRHDRRSSSRRKRPYDKNEHSSRRGSKYDQGRDYDRQKKHRSHKDSRDRKRRGSKSKSRSKSRSRSKNRVKSRRNNDYDSKSRRNKGDFEKSPRRSSSPNKKKYITKTKSKSRSVSNKSRSRSGHRDKYKDDKSKNKPVTFFEYEHKENRSEGSRSPSASKKKKRRDSGSRSHDRGKRRHDKSPQKSYYSRDKYHDNHKDSYHRKDNRDVKNQSDYKSSHRKSNYYSRNDYRDYDDKQRRRNRDNDRPHHRDKNRSRSKSVDRRSPSRSRSSKGSMERRRPDSIERREQKPMAAGNDTGKESPKANN